MSSYDTIDDYTADFSTQTRQLLNQVRATIHAAVPEAIEAISYGIPTFRLNGKNLVHYAAYEHHIGFYAIPNTHTQFSEELSKYTQGKGSVQFPLDEPMPLDLITRMTLFRVNELEPN